MCNKFCDHKISDIIKCVRNEETTKISINIDDELPSEEESVEVCDCIPPELSTKLTQIVIIIKQILKLKMLLVISRISKKR